MRFALQVFVSVQDKVLDCKLSNISGTRVGRCPVVFGINLASFSSHRISNYSGQYSLCGRLYVLIHSFIHSITTFDLVTNKKLQKFPPLASSYPSVCLFVTDNSFFLPHPQHLWQAAFSIIASPVSFLLVIGWIPPYQIETENDLKSYGLLRHVDR